MSELRSSYDVVIVGGAVIGSAVAYYLTADPDFDGSVLMVERDPTYIHASTALSAASIRTQFSNPLNVRMSQYAHDVIRDFPDLMEVDGHRPDLAFQAGGYMFLAGDEAQAAILQDNHEVQTACGADVVLLEPDEIAQSFPHLRVHDLTLASYGRRGEGWFDNTGLLQGFRNKARAQGAHVVHDEVVGIARAGARVTGVRLASGAEIGAGHVVNASGPRAARTARMAGLEIPVEPRKRTTFAFICETSPEGTAQVNEGRLPLMVDPSGVYCRPEGAGFIAAAPPKDDPEVDAEDFEPRYDEFEALVWPALAARSQAFEAIRMTNAWAGHYAYNTLDHNMIVGPHPELENFLFANGFSGHGLQQAPAAGRGVAELIVHGRYRTLDLSPAGMERILTGTPFPERAVI
ncbi:NAD(P)/FAD-dependent oxidoreductase [Roseovarius aestuariivivens]|uniref:NAD(P)/FAD-dependent oxidoreductase n=1 Tax=Roseovarius aestuariivivens TaxID=1888910 RepID=UPI0014368A3A|nr:FAD-binding oxidoreductase [Roseovarius aestuariivivens]